MSRGLDSGEGAATLSDPELDSGGFHKNYGMLIDLILLSAGLAARCVSCRIDRGARKGKAASDHAPVIVDLA